MIQPTQEANKNIITNYIKNILVLYITMKKKIRSYWAYLIVSNRTPKEGNYVVNTLRFLTHIIIIKAADNLVKALSNSELSAYV